jgi:hypothetical protein
MGNSSSLNTSTVTGFVSSVPTSASTTPYGIAVSGTSGAGISTVVEQLGKLDLKGANVTEAAAEEEYGGRGMSRVIRSAELDNAKALVFVVESNHWNAAWTYSHVQPKSRDVPVLFVYNKRDRVPTAKSPLPEPAGLIDKLGLKKAKNPWFIMETVATDGRGLQEGLLWLQAALAMPAAARKIPISARIGALPAVSAISPAAPVAAKQLSDDPAVPMVVPPAAPTEASAPVAATA